jgi:tRNA pseudouridine38-40 synthase
MTFIIEGDGFLYKMCRGIVGTLAQLGRGKFTDTALKEMLAAKDRRMAGMTAPAHGLVLCKVFYAKRENTKSKTKTTSRRPSRPTPAAVT